MLAKKYRLNGSNVRKVQKNRKISVGNLFTFLYAPQSHGYMHNRRSVSVPIRLSKKATTRNIIKRYVMNTIRELGMDSNSIQNMYYNVVTIISKKNASQRSDSLAKDRNKTIDLLLHTIYNDLLTIQKKGFNHKNKKVVDPKKQRKVDIIIKNTP